MGVEMYVGSFKVPVLSARWPWAKQFICEVEIIIVYSVYVVNMNVIKVRNHFAH